MSTLDIFRNARDFESYPAGHVVFRAGDPGNTMYVIKEGEVEIIINDKIVERFSLIGTSWQSVFAMTVALRGHVSISAISPTSPPGPTVSHC